MFKIKHTITLHTGEIVSLYGDDYFGDKMVFWDSHQTQLKALIAKVNILGGPVDVVEFPEDKEYNFTEIDSFLAWLSRYYPVDL